MITDNIKIRTISDEEKITIKTSDRTRPSQEEKINSIINIPNLTKQFGNITLLNTQH